MSWIGEIFSSSVGEVVKSVGGVVDDLVTSDEERLEIKRKLFEIETNAKLKETELENQYQAEITKRWEADAKSGWLSRNVRPLSLVYMLGIITIMAFFDGNIGTVKIDGAYVELFQSLSIVAFTAYFGSRGIEKIKGATK